jgi:hypothetical protein
MSILHGLSRTRRALDYFPPEARNVRVDTSIVTEGTNDLGGVFHLKFIGNGVTLKTRELQYDESAFGVKSALEELSNISEVQVERSTDPESGFTWRITFSGCDRNLGDVLAMTYENHLTRCKTPTIEVKEIVNGNGPSSFELVCHLIATYNVRACARNSEGYGQHLLSSPRFEIPTHKNPRAPVEPVLVSSTVIHHSSMGASHHDSWCPHLGLRIMDGLLGGRGAKNCLRRHG